MKGEIKKQINLVKKIKKNEVQNWYKNKNNVVIKWWNWKKINFTKGPRKKVRNQKDQLNWRTKLKSNKLLQKG